MVPPTGREVAAAATLALDHEAHFGRVCGDGYAIVSREGPVTVLDTRLATVRRLDLGTSLVDLSISRDRWAWVADARLWTGSVGGFSVPLAGAAACRWAPSGGVLWAAEGRGDHVRVESRTPDGRVTHTVT